MMDEKKNSTKSTEQTEPTLQIRREENPGFYSQITPELEFCSWITGQLAMKPSLLLWTKVRKTERKGKRARNRKEAMQSRS